MGGEGRGVVKVVVVMVEMRVVVFVVRVVFWGVIIVELRMMMGVVV